MIYKLRIATFFAILLCSICLSINAQKKQPTKTISAGVVNGKATSLPKPEYPEDARRAKASGEVKVQVLIDETGKVISAKAVSGPENLSLRQAAEAAALMATFLPTLLSGQPVKVSGVISYNFVTKSDHEEKLKIMAVSMMLEIARHFAADLDTLNGAMESPNIFKEGANEYPRFAQEFLTLDTLEKLSVDKRIEALNKASSSIQSKLSDSERWQFDVGQNLGGVMGPLMLFAAASKGEPDFTKIDEPAIRISLNKLKGQLLSASQDFPTDVHVKFKELAAAGDEDGFLAAQKIEVFIKKMTELFDTISPD
jgi:TonB family protein